MFRLILSLFLTFFLALTTAEADSKGRKKRRKSRSRASVTQKISKIDKTDIQGLSILTIGDSTYHFCAEKRCGRIRGTRWSIDATEEIIKVGASVHVTYRSSRQSTAQRDIQYIFLQDKAMALVSRCSIRRGRVRLKGSENLNTERKGRLRISFESGVMPKEEECKEGMYFVATGKRTSRSKFTASSISFSSAPLPPMAPPTPISTVPPKPSPAPTKDAPKPTPTMVNTPTDTNDSVLPDLPKVPPVTGPNDPKLPRSFDGAIEFKAKLTAQDDCKTDALGEARIMLWKKEKIATIQYTYSNLVSGFVAAHTHYVSDDSIHFDLDEDIIEVDGFIIWKIEDRVTFSADEQIELLENKGFYLNVHSANCPGGDIKGILEVVKNNDTPTPPPPPTPPNDNPPNDPPGDIPGDIPSSSIEVARFLNQATFGATTEMINSVSKGGISEYLKAQVDIPNNQKCYTLPKVRQIIKRNADAGVNANQMQIFEEAWWDCALNSPKDEVCHRVAFALSHQWVVSGKRADTNRAEALATYHDILKEQCFGNIKDVIYKSTLSPSMGVYLDMLNNSKLGANENYARELLQLFTVGLADLKKDGSVVMQGGKIKEVYTQEDINALGRLLTGWTWSSGEFGSDKGDWSKPMIYVDEEHDKSSKKFLGLNIPANGDGKNELTQALDYIFEHKNICPFTAKNLIQQLVSSNPTGDYITRVVNACENSKQRGSLKDMVIAILTDPEARQSSSVKKVSFGKLKQPIMLFAHLLKVGKAKGENIPRGCHVSILENNLHQTPFFAESVFNFFTPQFATPHGDVQKANLVSPEFQIYDKTTIISRLNYFTKWANSRKATCQMKTLSIDLSELEQMDIQKMVDTIDLLFSGGEFKQNSTIRNAIIKHIGNQKDPKNRVSKALSAFLATAKFMIRK